MAEELIEPRCDEAAKQSNTIELSNERCLASIAISLKRIADAICGSPTQMGSAAMVADKLKDIESAIYHGRGL